MFKNPFRSPDSASDGIRKQLERNYKNSNIPEPIAVNRREAIKAAKNLGPPIIKSGAEIGYFSTGPNSASPNLSNRAFRITSKGVTVVGAGVGTGITLATLLAQGEPPARAIARTTGQLIGGVVGAAAGSLVGGLISAPLLGTLAPVLGTIGAFYGGDAGEYYAAILYDRLSLRKTQPKPQFIKTSPITSEPPPFTGGQSVGVAYTVNYQFYFPQAAPPGYTNTSTRVLGKLGGVISKQVNSSTYSLGFRAQGFPGGGLKPYPDDRYIHNADPYPDGSPPKLVITSVVREDGQPDTGGNLFSPTVSRSGGKVIQFPPGTPPASSIPGGKLQNIVPLSADLPNQQAKRKPVAIQIPPHTPIRFSFDPSTKIPPFVFQSETPASINVAPAKINPATGRIETPITVKAPGSEPINLIAPGNAPVILNIPGQQPITINPDGTSKPTGITQSLADPTRAFVPTPVRPPTPTAPGITPPEPTTPATPEIPQLPNFKDRDLQEIGLTLVGITSLLKGLQNNTSTSALENAAAAGTCRTTQPGGCTSNAMDNAVQKGNKDLLNGLNTVGQGADLLLLREINNKLGPQIPGGISSGMGRLSKFLGIDRIFNLLNFLAILHNASMLSASLKVTLLETLSSVGNATGLLQTSEGDNVDLNVVFNKGVEGLVVSLIGAEAYASMKLSWRKYSSIYRAGANVLSNVGNMFSSIGNGIEVIGERTGKIGNALRAASVVRENAYNSFSERMNVHTSKFMTFQTTVGGASEVLEAVNEIAESTIEGQEAYTEAIKATTEFKKTLNESDKTSPGSDAENKAIAAEAAKTKENLVKDPTGEDETGLFSFLTN